MTKVCRTIASLRQTQSALKAAGRSSALVPTMGALHDGHLALVTHAASLADAVIATIFVNPTQFGPNEDLDRYPRQEQADLDALQRAGVHAVFMPDVEEMYGSHDATRILMEGPALGLESDFRPHFFQGVATVVSRLLLASMCDIAVFGEKDYQQLLVIKRMVADLKIPVAIQGSPTVREADGLALSSRNAYLSEDERERAPELNRALQICRETLRSGASEADALAKAVAHVKAFDFRPDYIELRDAQTLGPLQDLGSARLLAAAWLGKTRLIDNIAV
ncbi:pantoate--beta-alanine ligase [Ahrensia marina]|uniref:pantoate--beta-alanine ligase n=1 Tax=Ahrensia marina TaxID=1514904 RepID=UPI0035D12CE5